MRAGFIWTQAMPGKASHVNDALRQQEHKIDLTNEI